MCCEQAFAVLMFLIVVVTMQAATDREPSERGKTNQWRADLVEAIVRPSINSSPAAVVID